MERMIEFLKKLWRMMITPPNSGKGLIIRAERLEELYRTSGFDNYLNMANIYRELEKKNYPAWKNKQWIKENLRNRK
jgi:hypothetical protein